MATDRPTRCVVCGGDVVESPAVRQRRVPWSILWPETIGTPEGAQVVGVIDVGWACVQGHEWGFEVLTDRALAALDLVVGS